MTRVRSTFTALAVAMLMVMAVAPTVQAQDDDPFVPLDTEIGEPASPAGTFPASPTLRSIDAATLAASEDIVVVDGATQPVFGYADAIRERVWVQADFDSDLDGENDMIAMDIMRPAASEVDLKVPVIMDASPYFTTLCRGNEGECIEDTDGDGLNDQWPLFYDNYFVPRGYAVVLLHMVGTGFSNGCPVTGGTPDNLSAVAAIDWLNGRRVGVDASGAEVVADWHNGKSGMIGKSYDGTLANAAAATGVEGLTTIVPIAAISSWYDYSRSNGIRFNTNYPASLSNTVTNPSRRAYCSPVRTILNETDGDESGDYTDFWVERDYLPDVDKVTASVFVVHGLQDNNVKTNHFSQWWDALAANDVPRKMWLTRTGHEDAFDFRRAEWVETLHAWFDYWLQDVDNDVMDEPMVDVEYGPDEWVTYSDWPAPRSKMTNLFFRAPAEGEFAGSVDLTKLPAPVEQSFVDSTFKSENSMINDPEDEDGNRLVYLSEPLDGPLHVSGTPMLGLEAAVNDVDTNFGVILVDYGPEKLQVSTSSEGVGNVESGEEDCWGESSAADDACYVITEKRTTTATQWRVSKGIVDALNIYDVTTPTPLVPDDFYQFEFELLPVDYVFEAGHQIGIIVVGSYRSYSSVAESNAATITLSVSDSRLALPIVGGLRAASAAGIPSSNRHN